MALLDRETISDALRFWERGRIAYNAALILTALATAGERAGIFMEPLRLALLATLAALANILYCAAYPVDLFVQASDYRQGWRRHRWMLLAGGTLLAMFFAWLVTLAILSSILL